MIFFGQVIFFFHVKDWVENPRQIIHITYFGMEIFVELGLILSQNTVGVQNATGDT
jgi:hypothetical protein